MSKSWQIPRRSFLRGIGASLALPTLEIMAGAKAGAATGAAVGEAGAVATSASGAPLRLACIFQPNGVYPEAWDVKGEGSDFQLSPILAPLKDLKKHITVISGLDNTGRGHVQMTGAFLTGLPITNGRNAMSLDQMVARRIGGDTPLPSIELGTEPPRQGNASGEPIAFANTVSWSSETTRVSPEINPQVAFDRLFRSHSGPEAERRAARRKSVVDLVLDDARNLRRQASAADQHKIDEYLESVRAVEVRLDKTLNPPQRSWLPLSDPQLVRPGDGIPKDREAHLRLMIDLMVLGFWTDTTRVGTLMTAHGFSRQNFSFLDGVNSDHHGMSHHKNQDDAVRQYTRVSQWYVEQLAYMMAKMDAIDEGDGSLLDHSTIVYGSSMKDGNGHRKENLPILVAGSGGGKLKPGRVVRTKAGTPLANLHLSLARNFGVELDTFNGASSGPLVGLT